MNDVAPAKEVATHPQKPVDCAEIVEKLSSTFSTIEKPVLLNSQVCKDRVDRLKK